jgi:hypothetical protein
VERARGIRNRHRLRFRAQRPVLTWDRVRETASEVIFVFYRDLTRRALCLVSRCDKKTSRLASINNLARI